MNHAHYLKLREEALGLLLTDKTKEYYCHIQFVVEIAISLAKQLNVDAQIIEIACLLHDIGRDNETENESHAEAGARITTQIINKTTPDLKNKDIILNCIKHHNNKTSVKTQEDKIVTSADGASKVIFHQAFMLMCKKENFIDRAMWGIKYLKKGMDNILYTSLKKEAAPYFQKYMKIYKQVLIKSY